MHNTVEWAYLTHISYENIQIIFRFIVELFSGSVKVSHYFMKDRTFLAGVGIKGIGPKL